MHKILLSALFVLVCTISYGQKLTFGAGLDWSVAEEDKKDIPKIAKVWETYINSFKSNNSDSVRTDLWLEGSTDMLKYTGFNNILYTDQGPQLTFNIRKLNNETYEIITMSRYDYMDDVVNHVYRVCAIEKDGEFKLTNYFDVIKPTLNNYKTDCIEYYYPKWVDFDKKEAKKAVEFIRDFKKLYSINDDNIVTYIVGDNSDECSSMLGLIFTLHRSEKIYAGRAIYPRILLSARPNHVHELVHAVFIPLYPDAQYFLHEGIATYYGGGAQKSYQYHTDNVRKYLATNTVDFSDPDWVYVNLEGETYLGNTIGALIIAHTIKNYGYEKVTKLFECKTNEDVFLQLGVTKNEINNFVLHQLIR